MQVSDKLINWLKANEGEVLHVYNDGFGFPTVGVGHLVKPVDNLKLGDKITAAQSTAFLVKDLAGTQKAVESFCHTPLLQWQYDAVVSLVFNIGIGNFKRSSVLAGLNNKNFDLAVRHFADWTHSNGRVAKGLVRRRREEQDMFIHGVYNLD